MLNILLHTLPLADVGPAPLILPLGGSALVAGVFLAAALVTGGLWLIRRARSQPTDGPRRWFWLSLAGAFGFAAIPLGVIGLVEPGLLVPTVALVLACIVCVVIMLKTRRESVDREAP